MTHTYTPKLGWISLEDQPVAETTTWQYTTLTTERHPFPGGIRTINPNPRPRIQKNWRM